MADVVASDPILDLARPANLQDPHPAYARLRAQRPVFWYEPLNSWFLTRHADCVQVLRDSATFAADWRRVGEEMPPQAISVQTLDPPEHTDVRRLFMAAMRTRPATAVTDMVAAHTRQRLAALRGRTSFDLVTEFVEPLALSTITSYLGVPAPDVRQFVPMSNAIVDGMDAGLWPHRGGPAMAARRQLSELTDTWLTATAGDGIVAAVVSLADGHGVSRSVVANTLRVLLHAGYTSASSLLSLAAVALLRPGSDGLPRFAACDTATAVDELVRHTTPVQAFARACVDDTEVGGTRIRAGQAVTMLAAAANRDPLRFAEPDSLRLDRHPNPHLGFGRGAHSCLGSPFAATQAGVVLSLLAEQHPTMRAVAEPEYCQNLTVRRLGRFEVALT